MVVYPERLDLAQTPTPFYALDRFRSHLQKHSDSVPRLWIKRDDLSGCLTSGNKVRKLEFLLAEARREGCTTLITSGGVQSNHCRAVAVLGAQLGFDVHLLLRLDRDPDPVGNLFVDQLMGAKISLYSAREFNRLEQLFEHWQEHYSKRGISSKSIPTGGSNGTGLWGYISAAEELKQDFARAQIRPTALIHATGSGGTQAGLTLGCMMLNMDIRVQGYAVCDDAQYFYNRVLQDILEWRDKFAQQVDIDRLNINTNDNYIGPGYADAEPVIFETIKTLAQSEGIALDPVYTGKAFYGMIEDIKQGLFASDKDIVFLHTGGLFGLLAQQQSLNL
jgi:D-cysteine desulfhydrase